MKKILLSITALSALSFAGTTNLIIPEVENFIEVEPCPYIAPEVIIVDKKVPIKVIVEKEIVKEVFIPNTDKRGLYIAAGVLGTQFDTNCDCPDAPDSDRSIGAIFRAGYHLTDTFDVEARYTTTPELADGGSVDYHYGLFIKPNYKWDESVNLYALAGIAKTKTETTNNNVSYVDATTLSLGLGVDIDVSDSISVFVDYEAYIVDKDAPTINGVSVGLKYDF